MTWQPIDTAPKGDEILVWTQNDGAFVAFWSGFANGWRWTSHDLGGHEKIKPTHWKPLPDPPE
jgi:hypothetical protein